jgi:hypothetical protein
VRSQILYGVWTPDRCVAKGEQGWRAEGGRLSDQMDVINEIGHAKRGILVFLLLKRNSES